MHILTVTLPRHSHTFITAYFKKVKEKSPTSEAETRQLTAFSSHQRRSWCFCSCGQSHGPTGGAVSPMTLSGAEGLWWIFPDLQAHHEFGRFLLKIHSDIAVMVDWVLKTKCLSTHLLICCHALACEPNISATLWALHTKYYSLGLAHQVLIMMLWLAEAGPVVGTCSPLFCLEDLRPRPSF